MTCAFAAPRCHRPATFRCGLCGDCVCSEHAAVKWHHAAKRIEGGQ